MVALFGCGKREEYNPAATSSLTSKEAETYAKLIASSHGWKWCKVEPTGSMVPVFDSGSILVLEPVTVGLQVFTGDILRDRKGVTHRAREVKGDTVYISGDNNLWPDGWRKLSEFEYRVAAVIYARR